ncbi:MAG: Peroxiredoxin [Sphingobacterium sp.]|jgi:peroxiredoxin|nr:Peroxiredoxin [Sphingobacterium sp.]
MKKLVLFIICLLPVLLTAQEPFTLEGHLGKLKKGQKLYLLKDKIVIDSATVDDGRFVIHGEISEPELASISLEKNGYGEQLGFYLDKGKISIEGPNNLNGAKIKGSKINTENEQLENAIRTLDDTEACLDFAASHPDSYISLVALERISKDENSLDRVKEAYKKLSGRLKETSKGAALPALFGGGVDIGTIASDFTLNDAEGKPVKLTDYRGKYVLLDFWASWCVPCRVENPNLRRNYDKFKAKGFEVVGVSLDKTKGPWLKAIQDDDLPWRQVSDLKGWQSKVPVAFSVVAIPQNFLIDPNGRIIARDLKGDLLEKKLEEIYQGKPSEKPNFMFTLILFLIPVGVVCLLAYTMLKRVILGKSYSY